MSFEIHVWNVCTWTGADADGDEGEQGVCASQAFFFIIIPVFPSKYII